MAKDVIVVVQRDALPTEKESLDILLVSTTGEYPVDTYRDVASVEAVYGPDGPCPNAKIVRKATTLFNQGKTTLAETLLDKFKIVSFNPPSASPATTASFAVTGMTMRSWKSPRMPKSPPQTSSLPCSLTPALPRAARPTPPPLRGPWCATQPPRAARQTLSLRWWMSLRTSFWASLWLSRQPLSS